MAIAYPYMATSWPNTRTHLLHQTGFWLRATFVEFLRHVLSRQNITKQ